MKKMKINISPSAQCSPRHACTLKGSLLMQMHKQSQAAPELALTRAAGV